MDEQLRAKLQQTGQEHVLTFWERLDTPARQALARQIDQIDLRLIQKLTKTGHAGQAWAELALRAEPPAAFRLADRPRIAAKARRLGQEALAAGQVGLVIVAGGQGTRLGFPHPKGMFPIGPVSQATLFRILLEKTLARSRSAGKAIPVYLMTSPATHDETVEYLARSDNFGVAGGDVIVFCQGTMPAVDARTHKLLLADHGSLSLSPDGHGGLLSAFAGSGALADARRRGLRYLFYVQVDNPLVSIGDPEFLGCHIDSQSEVSTQVVAKRTSREKVGSVVTIDGKLQILEYSDLNPLADEIVDRRTADGSPVFWAGNIAVHIFNLDFFERVADSADGLPFHFARKAVPHVDPASGRQIEPEEPNALKFERFIFDLLPAAARAIVYEVDGETAFAPVKNGPGEATDSPQTVQRQMIALARSWLAEAGAGRCRRAGRNQSLVRPGCGGAGGADSRWIACDRAPLLLLGFFARRFDGLAPPAIRKGTPIMLHAVIMAGGAGTRFWPASRADWPKQLLALVGARTMIQATVDRMTGLVPAERTWIVTNRRLTAAIAEQLPELPAEQILSEPCKRNTAPCIGLAALEVVRHDPDAIMAVMPADHVIRPNGGSGHGDRFRRAPGGRRSAADHHLWHPAHLSGPVVRVCRARNVAAGRPAPAAGGLSGGPFQGKAQGRPRPAISR